MKLFDFDKLIDTLTGYIETRIELLKIDLKDGLTEAIARLAVAVVLAALAFFVILFAFMGIAVLLNDLLESSYLGYLIVSFFFVILLVVVVLYRKKLIARVQEKISEITKMTSSDVKT